MKASLDARRVGACVETGWCSKILGWVLRAPDHWVESQERLTARLGPLAAWRLARSRASNGSWRQAASAWALAPFDPGWELRVRYRVFVVKRLWGERTPGDMSVIELCRLIDEPWRDSAPVDWRVLAAEAERARLAEASRFGLDNGGSERPILSVSRRGRL